MGPSTIAARLKMFTYSLLIFACIVLAVILPGMHLSVAFHNRHRTMRADESVQAQTTLEAHGKPRKQIAYEETLPDAILAKEEFDQLMTRIQTKLKETQPKR